MKAERNQIYFISLSKSKISSEQSFSIFSIYASNPIGGCCLRYVTKHYLVASYRLNPEKPIPIHYNALGEIGEWSDRSFPLFLPMEGRY